MPISTEKTFFRVPYNKLSQRLRYYNTYEIGTSTPKYKAIPIINLIECLLDDKCTMPVGEYKMFKLIKDYGLRNLTCGNSSGGKFYGEYRTFCVEYNGNKEIVSLNISSYSTKKDVYTTSLNVAIDRGNNTHHSLQLVLDKCMDVEDDLCIFTHNGRISISNLGSGKISEFKEFVAERCPELMYDGDIYLGTIRHDRLWRLDDIDVMDLVENLITYALIRDEYREVYKSQRKQ